MNSQFPAPVIREKHKKLARTRDMSKASFESNQINIIEIKLQGLMDLKENSLRKKTFIFKKLKTLQPQLTESINKWAAFAKPTIFVDHGPNENFPNDPKQNHKEWIYWNSETVNLGFDFDELTPESKLEIMELESKTTKQFHKYSKLESKIRHKLRNLTIQLEFMLSKKEVDELNSSTPTEKHNAKIDKKDFQLFDIVEEKERLLSILKKPITTNDDNPIITGEYPNDLNFTVPNYSRRNQYIKAFLYQLYNMGWISKTQQFSGFEFGTIFKNTFKTPDVSLKTLKTVLPNVWTEEPKPEYLKIFKSIPKRR